jgi:hypothetical protein
VNEVTYTGKVLDKAVHECVARLKKEPIKLHKDWNGRVAYEIDDAILVAKRDTYGYIVSCHKFLVDIARNNNKWILMYLLKNNMFYWFDAKEIWEKAEENFRGGAPMLNFDINLGQNLEGKDDTKKQQGLDKWL